MHSSENDFYETWLEMFGRISRPRLFSLMLARAGVDLDRALFPVLVRVGVLGPIGVAELAELLGLDHSTISRELGKLESLDLVVRGKSASDGRVREASLTPEGRRMVETINAARRTLSEELVADWTPDERRAFTMLLRRLADSMEEMMAAEIEAQRSARGQTSGQAGSA